ncbi:MAG: hypothetical protein ACKV19_10420 [Verrucomicrobiales bacterium]
MPTSPAMVRIEMPHPPRPLFPNSREHWSRKAQATRIYRRLAAVRASAQMGSVRPRWVKARVLVEWHAQGKTHPDPDAVVSSMKAAFDGLQDAEVIINDRGLWPDRPVILTDQPWPVVVLTVTPEDAA